METFVNRLKLAIKPVIAAAACFDPQLHGTKFLKPVNVFKSFFNFIKILGMDKRRHAMILFDMVGG